ncbi:MAG: hypothetical protein CMI95_05805 [Pelagibacteraceae bacterium]|nr:hypothetical protein [Pelagibacteraceae bacterium]|tara:strand:- start:9954 stop:10745 length:792 start_codon:yes stop_codon:yes gene_type:complete
MNYKTAIILCGGKGSRMGQLGKKLPKTLVKVNNHPIIWYIINGLIRNSFNHFILPVGYKAKMIEKYFSKNFISKKIKIDIIRTGSDTSISNRIYKIKKKVISEDFLLLNGDAIFEFNLKKFFFDHQNKKSGITFIGCHAPLSYGVVGFKNKKIVSFEREMNFNSVSSSKRKNFKAYVYSGMSIMNKKVLNHSFKNFSNFEKELYPLLIKKYKSDFGSIKGFWHSIDNMKDLDSLKKTNNLNKFRAIKLIEKKNKKNEYKLLEK